MYFLQKLNEKAFTLIELIIAIAIIALLATATFVAVDPGKRLGDAKDAIRTSDAVAIEKAIQQKIADGATIPVAIAALPENTPYMLVTEGSDTSGTCNCNTLDQPISRIDLAGEFKAYVAGNVPIDEAATGDDTGYYIKRKGNSFYVEPCNAYGDDYVYVPSVPETITCYFDQYDVGGEEWWGSPHLMVDNNSTTQAESRNEDYPDTQLLTHSTCASQTFGTISQVRIRQSGFCMMFDCGVILRPVFGGSTDGDDYYYDSSATTGTNFNPWIDITNDTNAPGTWTTSDVVNLELDVETHRTGSGMYWRTGVIELEVTHTPL